MNSFASQKYEKQKMKWHWIENKNRFTNICVILANGHSIDTRNETLYLSKSVMRKVALFAQESDWNRVVSAIKGS